MKAPRTGQARLQSIAGDAGTVLDYVHQTGPAFRAPGWYLERASELVYLGFHERDALPTLIAIVAGIAA